MQGQGIIKGDVLQRMAAVGFIVAFVLTALVNALMPRAADPADTRAALQAIADAGTGYYRVLLLVGAFGFWAWVIGNAGIYRSLTTGAAAVWARLGFYMFLIGIAVGTAWGGVGLGTAGVLEELGTSAEAVALWQLHTGLVSVTTVVIWLAFAFLGVGMVRGTVHPRWLGWSLLGLGVLGAVVSIVQVVAGVSALVQVLRAGALGLTSLWALVFGIWLFRKAW